MSWKLKCTNKEISAQQQPILIVLLMKEWRLITKFERLPVYVILKIIIYSDYEKKKGLWFIMIPIFIIKVKST